MKLNHNIYVPFQIDRLTDQDNCDKHGKAITAMFRCVVRLEIKGCDFYCDGSGYGGDRDVIHQGQFSSVNHLSGPNSNKITTFLSRWENRKRSQIFQTEPIEYKADIASSPAQLVELAAECDCFLLLLFWRVTSRGSGASRRICQRLRRREITFNVPCAFRKHPTYNNPASYAG